MSTVKIGARLKSTVSGVEVIVVRTPSLEIELLCGGHPMVPAGESNATLTLAAPDPDGQTLVGKRYVHDPSGLEVLCTRTGGGALSVGSEPLRVKAPAPLPSSD